MRDINELENNCFGKCLILLLRKDHNQHNNHAKPPKEEKDKTTHKLKQNHKTTCILTIQNRQPYEQLQRNNHLRTVSTKSTRG